MANKIDAEIRLKDMEIEPIRLDRLFEEIYGANPDKWGKVRQHLIKAWNKGYPIGYYGN